jgi:tetratricopeptide (TPR) repeat protein
MKKLILLLLFIPLCFLNSQTNSKTYTNSENNYKTSKSEKAIEYYNKATYLSETASGLEINGDKDAAILNYKNAIDLFKKAILVDPLFTDAMDNLAVCYRRIGDVDNAIYYYKKSLKIIPNNRLALSNLGTAYLHINDFNKAVETYNFLLVNVDQNNKESEKMKKLLKAEPYYGLAQAYYKMEKYDKSKKYSMIAAEVWKENNLVDYRQDALYFNALSEYFLGNEKKATDMLVELANNGHQPSKNVLVYPE